MKNISELTLDFQDKKVRITYGNGEVTSHDLEPDPAGILGAVIAALNIDIMKNYRQAVARALAFKSNGKTEYMTLQEYVRHEDISLNQAHRRIRNGQVKRVKIGYYTFLEVKK